MPDGSGKNIRFTTQTSSPKKKKEYDLAVRHGRWVAIRDEKYVLFVSLILTQPAMHKCRKEKCRAWY